MENWHEALSIFGLLFGGGAVLKLLRYISKHDKAHADIERRISDRERDSKENKEDHKRIEGKLDTHTIWIRELLVHFDLKVPGQGVNGDD